MVVNTRLLLFRSPLLKESQCFAISKFKPQISKIEIWHFEVETRNTIPKTGLLFYFPPLTKMFQFSGYPIVLRTQNQNLKFYIACPVRLRSNLFGVTLRFEIWILRLGAKHDQLRFAQLGCPIRTSSDQSLFASYPKLIAGYYVLHRCFLPRHPPYTFGDLLLHLLWLLLTIKPYC